MNSQSQRNDAREEAKETLALIEGVKIRVEVIAEGLNDLLRLVLTQEAMVNEDADRSITDGAEG